MKTLSMMRSGFIVAAGIVAIGLLLQLCVGGIDWDAIAWPTNFVLLIIYIALLIATYVLRRKSHAIKWIMSFGAAVPALLITGIATVGYGITCIRETLSLWPFVLLYAWLTTIVGLVAIHQAASMMKSIINLRLSLNLGSFLAHLGLFIAIVCATIGSADIEKVSMEIGNQMQNPMAIEPLGIRLNHFKIDEYPPEFVVINNNDGNIVPEDTAKWNIKVLRVYDYAAENDTAGFVVWKHEGATTAALVSVNGSKPEWISNGSYMFEPKAIALDKAHSLTMPERAPKRFVANIDVCYNNDAQTENVDLEVNKPYKTAGWTIYLVSYDKQMGRWSPTCVVELIKDPWLPYVYIGIFLLLAGAVLMLANCLMRFFARIKGSISQSHRKLAVSFLIVLASAIVCLIVFYPTMSNKTLMPALQSPWFTPHIIIYMICYALLGAATLLTIVSAFVNRSKATAQPKDHPSAIDNLVYAGLSLMTVGMLFGALWAKDAWGHYWAWDPKETWAAATWLLYLTYIHLRISCPSKAKVAACLLVFAFCCLQMCWWGINYLPAAQAISVHTY